MTQSTFTEEIENKLLFICGFPSGGTDLLKNIINAHPLVYINGEMPFLYELFQNGVKSNIVFKNKIEIEKFRKFLKKKDIWSNLENIDADIKDVPMNLKNLLRIFFSNDYHLVWGNKTPQNAEHIKELDLLFPHSKFIIIVRDVRDVCLSHRKKWGNNIYNCSIKWAKRMRLALDQINELDSKQSLLIKYEDLITSTESVTKIICNFLNIEWTRRMLAHEKYIENVIDGKKNYGIGIKKDNLNKWEKGLNTEELRKVEGYSYQTLIMLGYKPLLANRQFGFSKKKYLFDLHDFLSLIFVGNRYSQNNSMLARIRVAIREVKNRLKKIINYDKDFNSSSVNNSSL
jgi:Sulfotransferase family